MLDIFFIIVLSLSCCFLAFMFVMCMLFLVKMFYEAIRNGVPIIVIACLGFGVMFPMALLYEIFNLIARTE